MKLRTLSSFLLAGLLSFAVTLPVELNANQSPEAKKRFEEKKVLAEKGDADAQFFLGASYQFGIGVPKDYIQAVSWYRKAAEQGDLKAQYTLGLCYADGLGVSKDEVQAAFWYHKAAEQGDADAQFFLGVCYANGEGVPKDRIEAYALLNLASVSNEDGLKMREIIKKGMSVEALIRAQQRTKEWQKLIDERQKQKGIKEGLELAKVLAEKGDAVAQIFLGVSYAFGRGVPKDEVQAAFWYRKAAEQGVAEAQSQLGNCYNLGKGVPRDEVQAVFWYRKAAEQGLAQAQYNLGVHYGEGLGVPKDEVQAAFWYRKAAEQGDADAQNNLGVCYVNGQGVPKDDVEAYALYNLAGVKLEESRTYRDNLVKRMSSEAWMKGQQRTKEWQKLIEERQKAKAAGK